MGNLALYDRQILSQSIQQLYTLRNLDTFGIEALSIVNHLVPSDIPCFHINYLQQRRIEPVFLPDFPGYTPEMAKVVYENFDEHPSFQHMPMTLHGTYKISDFISAQQLYRLEGLYQQFLRPLHGKDQLGFFFTDSNPGDWQNLLRQDATLVAVSLTRPQRNFKERDRLMLNLLRPHLIQAYSNAQHYQKLQNNFSQLQQSFNQLGLVIINAAGKIQFSTPQASNWLDTYFPKPLSTNELAEYLWDWVKHQIANFIKNPNLPTTCLPLQIRKPDRKLIVRLVIEQQESKYLLLLEEQPLSLMNSLALIGLSHRETEVLFWVLQGKKSKLIATEMNIYNSTVRKHLESIYLKLGVTSRTEAIAKTLEKLGFFDDLPLQ
jgi:DNA-binding CsgD family transcriptional regulator